jgi:hypothetical protein
MDDPCQWRGRRVSGRRRQSDKVGVMRNLFSRFERAVSGMPAVLIGVAASLTSIAIIVGVKSLDSGAPFN